MYLGRKKVSSLERCLSLFQECPFNYRGVPLYTCTSSHGLMTIHFVYAVELQPQSVTLGSYLLEHLLMSLNETKKTLV